MTGEDVAREAHRHCVNDHATHDFTHHQTAWLYATAFAAYKVSPKDLIDTIIELAGDPADGSWTYHPAPDVVLARLQEKGIL